MLFSAINRISKSKAIIHPLTSTYRQLIRQKDLKFSNDFFWNKYISSIYSDIGYMGIKNKFIYEYGKINYIEFQEEGIYQEGEVLGVIENEKTIYDIRAPLDDFQIHSFNHDLQYEHLNKNPESLNNHILTFTVGNPQLYFK